jgi:hypothetical protein
MKKYFLACLLICLTAVMFSQNIITTRADSVLSYQPKSNIVATRTAEASLLKPTIYNSARFLSYRGGPIVLDHGMEQDMPGLSYTFSLTKNTIIQISQTVFYSTSHCVLCPEAGFNVWVYVNNEVFATYYYGGNDKVQSVSGSELAQLGPGTHTIKIRVGGYSNAGDVTVYGSNNKPLNFTHMSLLFFPEE